MQYTKQQLLNKLRKLMPMLHEKYGIRQIGVFGSYAIHAQHKKSDVDLLLELNKPLGWTYFELSEILSMLLNVKVDVTTKDALKPRLRNGILKQDDLR